MYAKYNRTALTGAVEQQYVMTRSEIGEGFWLVTHTHTHTPF